MRRYWPELLWGVFAAANVAFMVVVDEWQTVPFHFVWVSLTILYGFRVWPLRTTALVLVAVGLTTGAALWSGSGIDEMTEVPLMSAMFLAMVWHARRRDDALATARSAAERERDFIRDASHLLRTPITVARGHAELVAASASAQDAQDLGVVVDELQRLSRISSRLLVLASAEHPDFQRNLPVELGPLVESTVRRWGVGADRELRAEVLADGTVEGDEERLVAALDAVVENAIKATEPGSLIVVRARAEDGAAVLEVADRGRGIPADALPHVFDRFVRQPHPTGGTGLGLPIVKAIVEAHGGTASVVSAPGEGTTVSLRLPGYEPAAVGARSARADDLDAVV
jgi:signal transduction histidine kinase